MNLLLIAPSSGKWRHVGKNRIVNGRTFRFSLLSLLRVAAATPPDVKVTIVDEQFDDIPWDFKGDLVGITCMTALAPRAYEIAGYFRARGIPVVLGGFHPTFCSEEALRHADAIMKGEAETVWPTIIEIARAGRPQGIFSSDVPPNLAQLKSPPYHLLKSGKYSTYPVEATRGCAHKCAFCSITAFHRNQQRQRPVDAVIDEIQRISSRFFIFIDDNLIADRSYAAELLEKLIPLKKMWVTQATISVAEDLPFVKLMADAGCIGIFAGLETVSDCNLVSVSKGFNKVNEYRDATRILHEHGIGVEAGIVLGFDGDDVSVFANTLNKLDEWGIDAIQASIFTPLPGTPKYESMRERLLDKNWAHYDFHHAVFQPQGMPVESLQAGHDWLTAQFYTPWRISKRMARWARQPRGLSTLPYMAAVNLAYFGRIRLWHIQGWNPAEDTHCFSPVKSPVVMAV